MNKLMIAASLAATVFFSSTPAFAQKAPKAPKAPKFKLEMKIDNRVEIKGDGNTVTVSADYSQNVQYRYSYTDARQDNRQWHDSHDDSRQWHTSDSRQWHSATTTTDSRQWHQRDGDVTYAPRTSYTPAPQPAYVATPRVELEPVNGLTVRCWAPCGGYFIDVTGRKWVLLGSYAKVEPAARFREVAGRVFEASDGRTYYSAIWPSGITRTFYLN